MPRDRPLQLIAQRGRMGWQKLSGHNWRGSMEADIGRFKRGIGDVPRSRAASEQSQLAVYGKVMDALHQSPYWRVGCAARGMGIKVMPFSR